MKPTRLPIACGLVLAAVFLPGTTWSETSVRGEAALAVNQLTIHGEFSGAIDSSRSLTASEPDNPVGYLLLALAYYAINSQYRNDNYADSVSWALDTTIALAERRADREPDPTETYFVLGSAYGCRALYRSIHSGWYGAFKDGVHSSSNLGKAYQRDSSLTDALSGVGAYHYWKSAKSGILGVLPFVKDRRKQGIAEILSSVEAGGFMAVSARKSLLAIYYNEKQYEEVLAVGDSLASHSLLDPNCSLHIARALIKLKRWAEANLTLDRVLAAYENSPYFDTCGCDEVIYLQAEICAGQGDVIKARQYLQQILDDKDRCQKNEYYR